jgi:BirA family biotin operon repressor/biotin-[acetyl-CoA-carboxylase] ligase
MDINSLTQPLQFKILYLDVVTSTNTLARERLQLAKAIEGSVIFANEQTQGRGQLNSVWESNSGKNVLCSIVLSPVFITIDQQTYLNMAMCLAMLDTIKMYTPDASIKWPNDIYINKKKVAGLLLENAIQGDHIKYSIVGIGINVNQLDFVVKSATSLCMETQHNIVVDEVLQLLLKHINHRYGMLKLKQWDMINKEYHQHLLGLNEECAFKTETEEFVGVIKGVDVHGLLMVKKGDSIINYRVKEISML